MKTSIGKRIGSGILALAITASMYVGGSVSVFAGDTLPYPGDSAKGENQPYQHGYRGEDLLAWSPETDPYAELLRAQIPLQNRNAAFAATQADPNLSAAPEYFTLTGDYGNAFFDGYSYTNEFSQHLFNFWQYVDYYASRHGMPTEEVPESLYNAEGERNGTSDWTKRTRFLNSDGKMIASIVSLGTDFVQRGFNESTMHLYKSNLDVNNASKMDVAFKKSSDDSAAPKLGVIFKDDPDTVVKFDIANSSARSEEWVTSTVDLSAYAGKEIAAFGLVVDGEASDYQINIGQMKYTSGEAIVPAAPTGLTIDKAYDTGEMVVS